MHCYSSVPFSWLKPAFSHAVQWVCFVSLLWAITRWWKWCTSSNSQVYCTSQFFTTHVLNRTRIVWSLTKILLYHTAEIWKNLVITAYLKKAESEKFCLNIWQMSWSIIKTPEQKCSTHSFGQKAAFGFSDVCEAALQPTPWGAVSLMQLRGS